jgi:hypothetical protein
VATAGFVFVVVCSKEKTGAKKWLLVWRLPFCRHPKTRDLANSNVVVVVGAAAAAAVARIDGGSGL